MVLDWGVACSGAGGPAGDEIVSCTSEGVCASPSDTLGHGREAYGVADCAKAGEMEVSFIGSCGRI